MNAPPVRKVVFAPDLIGAALFDPDARRVLELWRDDAFKVVCNRQLLVLHVKALREIGVTAELIKRWTLWLTAPEKAIYLSEAEFREGSPVNLCNLLAKFSRSDWVLSWQAPTGVEKGSWMTARELLKVRK